MSTSKTEQAIAAAKAVKNNKKGVAKAHKPTSNGDWRSLTTDDVKAVHVKGHEGDDVKFIMAEKDARGNRTWKEKNTLAVDIYPLLALRADAAGEGNLTRTGLEFKPHRGNCKFTMLLTDGNLSDGVDRPDVLELQKQCFAKLKQLSRKLDNKACLTFSGSHSNDH